MDGESISGGTFGKSRPSSRLVRAAATVATVAGLIGNIVVFPNVLSDDETPWGMPLHLAIAVFFVCAIPYYAALVVLWTDISRTPDVTRWANRLWKLGVYLFPPLAFAYRELHPAARR